MKKLLLIFCMAIAGSPFLSSCKKLKEDIKDLKGQVNDLKNANDTLKNKNAELQGKLNGVIISLGSDEPISATTTFQDNNGATRTISGVYKFKSADYQTQCMIKNANGTYDIYIDRFSDVSWREGAWTGFTYNPATKAITNIEGGQYWADFDPYGNNVYYSGIHTGLTMNVTIDSLNMTTGAISLKFTASGTGVYTSGNQDNVPNPGKPVSTSFTFAGKLKLFDRN